MAKTKAERRRLRLAVVAGFGAGVLVVAWVGRKRLPLLLSWVRPYERDSARVTKATLIINRWSGDGKAEHFGLAERARELGITPVMLERGDDLTKLARDAVDAGADAIGMAGGDGSLGLVAGVAIERDVPFFCIPVGTRNHFALDVGLDRDDPLAALEAVSSGEEIQIDYGQVADRVFLNNVSLGLYAMAVHRDGYRAEKAKTILDVVGEMAASPESRPSLKFVTADGRRFERAVLVLVSNNRYAWSGPPDFGRRARLDDGVLGAGALTELPRGVAASVITGREVSGMTEWEVPELRIDSDDPVIQAGVDGEALTFEPPLELRTVRRGLRVLVPAGTRPGYAPAGEAVVARLLDLAELGGENEPTV